LPPAFLKEIDVEAYCDDIHHPDRGGHFVEDGMPVRIARQKKIDACRGDRQKVGLPPE
jgi:hypothetical protein